MSDCTSTVVASTFRYFAFPEKSVKVWNPVPSNYKVSSDTLETAVTTGRFVVVLVE